MDAARAMAAACHRKVESLADRTMYAQAFIGADGKGEWVSSPAPQRIRRANGSWDAIDLTLQAAGPGGTFKPTASLADVRFSPGGSGPMITWAESGEQFNMSWPGVLPAPRVDGPTAIYANVFPEVDLHVTATLDGFTHVLEVKTPAATANPAVRTMRFATSGNLKLAETVDGLELRDPSGTPVAYSQNAAMWDSGAGEPADMLSSRGLTAADGDTASEGGDPATAQGAGDTSRTAPVTVDADATGLTVTADAGLLANATYPVFIDPPFSKQSVLWAYATSNGENNDATHARVGRQNAPDGSGERYRSYWSFPTTGLPGTQILSASVKAKLYHSGSCADTPVYAYSTSSITVGHKQRMAWTDRPLPNSNYAGSWSGSANKGDCPQPDADAVFDDAQMRTEVQATATAGWSSFIIGLCACDSAGNGESDGGRWKKFYVEQTYLIAQFALPPYQPIGQSLRSPDCAGQCPLPAMVNTTTPKLWMSAKAPYGGTLTTCFEVRTAASDTATIVVKDTDAGARDTVSIPASNVKDAAPAADTKIIIPSGKLLNGSTYFWRATTKDENSNWSGWSPWYQFTVDTTSPGAPTVSSTDYPYKAWAKGVNQAGVFTLTGPAEVYSFTYAFDGGNTTTVTASGTTTKTATVTYTPATAMAHTLRVTSKDVAGNLGTAAADYQFWVNTSISSYAHWKLDETAGVKTAAVDPLSGSGSAGTVSNTGADFASGGKLGNAITFTARGDVVTAGPVLDTSKSFTVTAWAKLADPVGGDYQTVLSQAGTASSRFQLFYDRTKNGGAGGWCFTVRASDSATAATASACTVTITPTVGEWTHLAGIYDQPNNKIWIYVMGGNDTEQCYAGEQQSQTATGSWQANGGFVIGRANNGTNGAASAHFYGGVDDVWAYQKVVAASDICDQARQ